MKGDAAEEACASRYLGTLFALQGQISRMALWISLNQ